MRIPIVNEQDEILCYKDDAERDGTKEITRTSALWLYNEQGEFLIARRSKNKKRHPNLWHVSVSGRNEEGETYESNIVKEAREELGIALDKVKPGPKELISKERLFFVKYFFSLIPKNSTLALQKSEVDEVKWVPLVELEKWFSEKPEEFSPHFGYTLKAIAERANQS